MDVMIASSAANTHSCMSQQFRAPTSCTKPRTFFQSTSSCRVSELGRLSRRWGLSEGIHHSVCRGAQGFDGVRVRVVVSALQGGAVASVEEKKRGLYDDFMEHAVNTVGQHADLVPLPCQEEYSNMVASDGQALIKNMAFESTKFRLFRVATIDGGDNMQMLNVAICARPEYDLPIFCADFFSTASRNIIVLWAYLEALTAPYKVYPHALSAESVDLNPLYNIEQKPQYNDKYFSHLLQLGHKYAELLPWGDKLTAESLQFFSPILIWTRPNGRDDIQKTVFSAFQDYLVAWLQMAESAQPSADKEEIACNQEAHHRYLMWRATKDPGRYILMRLYGEPLCERYISEFLFNGVKTLGTKSFLDYFPDYRGEDGSILKQRSMVGKSYAERPWNKEGVLIPAT